jgi:nucleoside-diphosphate-sugar epimerase
MTKRALIIGGTAFIGPAVVRHLVREGVETAVYHRGQTEGDLPEGVRHFHDPALTLGDRRSLSGFREEIEGFDPDLIVDMILLTEQDARILLETLPKAGRQIVMVSSVDVYQAYNRLTGKESGDPEPGPLTEDSPLRQVWYPFRSDPPRAEDDPRRWTDSYDKIPAERLIVEAGGTAVRLPMVYGPHDKQHRLYSYLKRMDDGRPAIILDDNLAGWKTARGYVENMAWSIALAGLKAEAAGLVYHVAEEPAFTEAGWVAKVAERAGWHGQILQLSPDALPEGLRSGFDARHHLAVDSSRIRSELGYDEIVPLDDALDKTIAWERDNPPPSGGPSEEDYAREDDVLKSL